METKPQNIEIERKFLIHDFPDDIALINSVASIFDDKGDYAAMPEQIKKQLTQTSIFNKDYFVVGYPYLIQTTEHLDAFSCLLKSIEQNSLVFVFINTREYVMATTAEITVTAKQVENETIIITQLIDETDEGVNIE